MGKGTAVRGRGKLALGTALRCSELAMLRYLEAAILGAAEPPVHGHPIVHPTLMNDWLLAIFSPLARTENW